MNKLVTILLLCFLFALTSCSKYEMKFGVANFEESKELEKEIVYIDQKDIYLTDKTLVSTKQVTKGHIGVKTNVVISYNHDKIAYLNYTKTPIILDTSGQQLEKLTNHTGVDCINWSPNDKSFYFLKNNQLFFHGISLDVSITNLEPNDTTIKNYKATKVVVSEFGDVAYFGTYELEEEVVTQSWVWDAQLQKDIRIYDTSTVYHDYWRLTVNYKDDNLQDHIVEDEYDEMLLPSMMHMRFLDGSARLYYAMANPRQNGVVHSQYNQVSFFNSPNIPYPYFAGLDDVGEYFLYVSEEGLILYHLPKSSSSSDKKYLSFYKKLTSTNASYYNVNADWK